MYKYATAIGIDVGRTGINYGIVRQDGEVLWRNRIRYSRQRNKTAVLRKLFDVVDDVLPMLPNRRSIRSVSASAHPASSI